MHCDKVDHIQRQLQFYCGCIPLSEFITASCTTTIDRSIVIDLLSQLMKQFSKYEVEVPMCHKTSSAVREKLY